MKLMDSALTLAAVTALLYCASTAYTHGYMIVFALDSDVLDRNFHQSIFHGMILSLKFIIYIPLAWAGIVSVRAAYILSVSSLLKEGLPTGRTLVKLKKLFRLRTSKRTSFEKAQLRKAIHSWVILLSAFIFLLFLINFETKGKETANKTLNYIANNNYTTIKPKGSSEAYAYLFCGSRNCAGLKPDTKEIFYFPQVGHSILKRVPEKPSTETVKESKPSTPPDASPDVQP